MSRLNQVDGVPPIRTERLELISFSPAFMRAVLARDMGAAEADLGAGIPRDLRERLGGLFETRVAEIAADPSIRPWVARGMVLTDDLGVRRLVGSVGFHGPPDAKGRAEIGYHVEPNFRRRGLAIEAVRALLDWASREHDIRSFRASIAPTNAPSVAVVNRLGFLQKGSHWDDEDGEELIFERDNWIIEAAG